MSLAPEQQVEELVQRQNVSDDEVFALFDQLKPVKAEQFIGAWKGGSVRTNHPVVEKMTSMNWAGKDFRSTEDVDPIVVYKDDGSRVWNADWGHARLRPMEYRGVVTTAMIYDDQPIIDYFRYVRDDLLLGAMDAKKADGTFFFYLHK
ncbi:hypothetical protein N7532_000973 [Penicillium argentinense]|uniref:DUF4334 domain-containing protein n=1 Tax=Penicillium argentinense TaxID=1131581 RepID=A0A9W9G1M8_9EURO|nr:uncharacterized protein N7532_000973 [Penicillium argentinense]KAJ5110438.1 hypothetical protein N7532_000973 [Penicillium argentinense]